MYDEEFGCQAERCTRSAPVPARDTVGGGLHCCIFYCVVEACWRVVRVLSRDLGAVARTHNSEGLSPSGASLLRYDASVRFRRGFAIFGGCRFREQRRMMNNLGKGDAQYFYHSVQGRVFSAYLPVWLWG